MSMLSAYMDETGHSQDERQRFVGMAGLIAPTANWEVFEQKWKATLQDFKIPYFHMKDFANFKRAFKDWNEPKRRDLFGKLMDVMEGVMGFPFGTIIPMDAFRSFSKEQQKLIIDPYFWCYQSLLSATTVFLEINKIPEEEKVALVFSDQVEFKHQALRIYDILEKHGHASRSAPPIFRDMREIVPLQAADIVAYEMYKECERQLYRPSAEPRFGYRSLCKMSRRHGLVSPVFRDVTRDEIAADVEWMEDFVRRKKDAS